MALESVVTPALKKITLFFGCVLATQTVLARSDSDAVFFEVVKMPGGDATLQLQAGVPAVATSALSDAGRDVAALQAAVARLESAGDYYSPALAEQSAQLGQALQRTGDHAAALQALGRSLMILRRNEGLHSQAQVAVLGAQIDSQLALGDLEACDELQQARFSMQLRLLAEDPLRLAAAYANFADWEIRYYFKASDSPPAEWGNQDKQALLADRLARAFRHYHEALGHLASANSPVQYDDMVAIERKIAAITLMVDEQYRRDAPNLLTKAGQRSAIESRRKHNRVLFEHGTSALTRTVEYSEATSQPALVAERMLELADWYLLMDQHDEARALYGKAARLLRDAGMPEEQIGAIMQTGMPVRDPGKELAAIAAPTPAAGFYGYVDVTLDVDRYGQASNTQLDTAGAMDATVQRFLMQRIREDRFRPTYEQGTLVDSKNISLRYYFAQ